MTSTMISATCFARQQIRFFIIIASITALGLALLPDTVQAQTGYPVVDTGQTACYDDDGPAITCPAAGQAFYGQDAQFDGHQPSYTLSGDGLTVYDNVTGLTWTKSPDWNSDHVIDVNDKMTFAAAQAYPATLNAAGFGGYSDWRLPTMKELYSLMDFRGTDPSGPNPINLIPFIDTNTFDFDYGDESAGERLIDAQFWSSNTYVDAVFGNQTCAFGLNLGDGRIKCYPSDTSGPVTKVNYVYFVRGNTTYGLNSFTANGDGTVTDSATGLMWSQNDSGDGASSSGPRSGMTWEAALAWVEQKNSENYLGYNDWRLPNAKEMHSLLDYSRAPGATGSAAIDPVFNITQITNEAGQTDYPWFWTGTTHVRVDGDGSAGVYICFGRAMGYMNSAWKDVHGAGAQRSDEKRGDFSGYTYVSDGYYFANSPQGDAVRVYNYVRLVRDAPTTGGSNVAPTANAGGPYSTTVNTTLTLDGSGSTDTDGTIVLYEWDLDNDGGYDDATGATASFSAIASGTVTVSLRVTDDDSATDTDTATVTVTPPTYTLTVTSAGSGSGVINLTPGGGVYDYGAVVTLTASPDTGSTFTGWSGDESGTANPLVVTMDSDKAITATFSPASDTTPPDIAQMRLTTPTSGASLTDRRPAFDWDDASDSQSSVVSYTLLITTNNDSLSVQQAADTVTTTVSSFTPTVDLATGVYTWTVRAHDSAGNVSAYFSPPATFEIVASSSGSAVYLPLVIKQ